MGMAVLLLAGVLAGCRNGEGAAAPDGRRTVRVFLLLISTRQVEFYRWAEAAFEAQHPDTDVVIEQFPGSSLKDFEIKLRLRFSSGQPPDVFSASEVVMGEYARLGLLAPAPPAIEKIVQEKSLNAMVRQAPYFDGTCYGVVGDAAWQALYYNKDHFRAASLDPERPPATWAELLDYAERLTVRAPDGSLARAGLSLRKTGFKPGTAEKWYTFLYSAGGRPFTTDGTRATLNTEAGRAAIGLYKSVLFEKKLDAVEHGGDQQGFGQGRVAMFLREAHVIRWLRENYPDLDFGVAPVPARDTSLTSSGSYVWMVSRDAPYPEAAWQWIAFLMQEDVYARYAAIGGILPMVKAVAARPEYRDDPHLRVFLEQSVAPPYSFPRYNRANDLVGAYVERFCYGRIGADEMLERAERDLNALLAPNRKRKTPTMP